MTYCVKEKKYTKSETKKNCLCAHEHIRTKDTISGWRKEERTMCVDSFMFVIFIYFYIFFALFRYVCAMPVPTIITVNCFSLLVSFTKQFHDIK